MMDMRMMKNCTTGTIRNARFALVLAMCLLLPSLFVSTASAQNPTKQQPATQQPATQEPVTTTPSIEPAPQMQSTIARTIADDAADRQAAIDELKASAKQDAADVVRQMLIYHAAAKTTQQSMAFGTIQRELALPAQTVVRATVPMLDADDAKLQKAAGGVLAQYENASATRPPDFSYYREIIADAIEKKQSPPQGLVSRMYDLAPGVALLTMMRSHRDMTNEERKTILWAEHIIADTLWKHRFGFLSRDKAEPAAVAQLEKLARHPAWWARLFAAEIMRKHAALRSNEILKTLLQDESDLVRHAAEATPMRTS